MHQVRAVLPALLIASMSFEAGSKEQQALIRAVSALNPLFGKADAQNMVPAALQSMARSATAPGGPAGSQPPPPGGAPPGMPPKPPGPSMGPGNPELGGEA
jgi:hypothetical protein